MNAILECVFSSIAHHIITRQGSIDISISAMKLSDLFTKEVKICKRVRLTLERSFSLRQHRATLKQEVSASLFTL